MHSWKRIIASLPWRDRCLANESHIGISIVHKMYYDTFEFDMGCLKAPLPVHYWNGIRPTLIKSNWMGWMALSNRSAISASPVENDWTRCATHGRIVRIHNCLGMHASGHTPHTHTDIEHRAQTQRRHIHSCRFNCFQCNYNPISVCSSCTEHIHAFIYTCIKCLIQSIDIVDTRRMFCRVHNEHWRELKLVEDRDTAA